MSNIKKVLISVLTISAVAVVAFAATSAFFSDTETSTGNKLVAGEIDLKIDNESYIDQGEGLVLNDGTTWGIPEGQDDPLGLFFDFRDLKPGDLGEDTVSIHLSSNPAWLCVDLDITANSDESCTEPEDDPDAEDGACVVEDEGDNGDLAGELNFVFWEDDGDNVFEDDEVELTRGPASNVLNGVTWALAEPPGEPIQPGVYYIGKAWCFGDLAVNPVPADRGTVELEDDDDRPDVSPDSGVSCDGSLVGNEAQTDLLMGDISFRAVQARHNDQFSCAVE